MSGASRFWSPAVRGLEPYVPGEQPRGSVLAKLNTNENPYPPPASVLDAIRAATDGDLRLYPDPNGKALKAQLAEPHGLAPAQVFLGNGSDEVLAHVFCALLRHGRPVLFPDVSYSFYPVYCALYGIEARTVPLDGQFRVDVAAYAGRPNGGIVLPNPNAPTGIALEPDALRRLLEQHPDSVVVIDEAYVDFGARSALPLLRDHPNLLVVRTLSKSHALAGLRVGFAFGDAALIEGLERVKSSFNSYPLDRLALAGAQAALRDTVWFEQTRARIVASRERLSDALRGRGFEVLPSAANFVFARHPRHAGAGLQQQLRQRQVLVRHFAQPRTADWLRISIGTDAQCDCLLAALDEILSAPDTAS